MNNKFLPILIGALWTHAGFGWVFSNENGGWEYPLYLSVLAIAEFLLGDGAFALGRALDRKLLPVRQYAHA